MSLLGVGASAQFTSLDLGDPPPKEGKTIEVTPMKEYTVTGYGTSFGSYNASDQGRFVYVKLTGDFDVSLRIKSVKMNTACPEIHLMVRKSLDPKDVFFSSDILYHRWNTEWVNRLYCRSYSGGFQEGANPRFGGRGATWLAFPKGATGPFPDYWLRVKREGNAFHGYFKSGAQTEWTENVNWSGMRTTWQNTTNRAKLSQTFLGMGNEAYVGMALSTDVDKEKKWDEGLTVTFSELTGFDQAGANQNSPAAQAVFPIRVSENGRYFIDQKGQPVFWLGTTQWNLFRDYNLEEARTTLERIKRHGFAFAQVMLLGAGDGTKTNVYGESPWASVEPLTPNEGYFRRVDAVVRLARQNNVAISLTLYHQRWRKLITEQNARTWAKWLARRYKGTPNLVWSMTPQAKPEFVPVLRELAAGLREGDGGAHLITFKPDPAPYSSSFIHGESWLDFNSMQTWKSVELIYPFVTKDYGLKPVKPVLMGEGAYEHGSEYGFDVTPLWVRRPAYYSYLAGGHHTYGHNDSWRVLPTWKQSLDAPGAVQMGILRKVFEARKEWWKLVPDQTILLSGGKTEGQVLNLAARHLDGRWLMVYLAAKASVTVDLGKFQGSPQANATWIDPRTGEPLAAINVQATAPREFTTPEGWEDALLIIE